MKENCPFLYRIAFTGTFLTRSSFLPEESFYNSIPETLNKRTPPIFFLLFLPLAVCKKQFPGNRRYEIIIQYETNGMWRSSEL